MSNDDRIIELLQDIRSLLAELVEQGKPTTITITGKDNQHYKIMPEGDIAPTYCCGRVFTSNEALMVHRNTMHRGDSGH